MVESFHPDWIWFSRYEEGTEGSSYDCDLRKIPESFGPGGFYRSVRFRVSISPAIQQQFEQSTMAAIDSSGFKATGFLNYSHIDDLSGDRFLAEPRTEETKKRRAALIVRFLDASATLFMDAIIGPDEQGLYRLEQNAGARWGSSFLAIRHLFCNMTNAPTPVFINQQGEVQPHPSGEVQILIRTTAV
jgi:hypothetical protein